jgi:hypothetical protein
MCFNFDWTFQNLHVKSVILFTVPQEAGWVATD